MIVLVSMGWLKAHEEITSWECVHGLKDSIMALGAYTQPLLVDVRTGAILDGHHRYAVGMLLKLKRLPCILVDYLANDLITVEIWPECDRPSLTKEDVIQMSLSPYLFPPKTSRHQLSYSMPPTLIPLAVLG